MVYTWVDGAFPGYAQLLETYASTSHDRNPNRYRDNLDLLKFSLRSLERFMPWVRTVHLVSMRPQVPRWLNPERVRIVHHDAIFAEAHLPTFNSFAIVSNLCRIPDLSTRFLYLEDDRFFMRPVGLSDFVSPEGKLKLYQERLLTPKARERAKKHASPWNLALAEANHLLDERYGSVPRRSVKKAPLFIDRGLFERFEHVFADALAHNRSSRFRAPFNAAVEHLYPYFLWHEGWATEAARWDVLRNVGYLGLERSSLYNAAGLSLLSIRRPKLACLNDNYGHAPPERAVRIVKRFLERTFPARSRFERD